VRPLPALPRVRGRRQTQFQSTGQMRSAQRLCLKNKKLLSRLPTFSIARCAGATSIAQRDLS
ncbi:MAG TPA: hypothetical protein VF624_17890, partial [Tepidisphaeraceae bacterium]